MNFHIATEEDRPDFPLKHFNDPLFDMDIFVAAWRLIKDYKGDYWDGATTEAGVPFMMLRDHPECVLIRPSTGEELIVDNVLAGMIMTHSVLLGRIRDGMSDLTKQHRDLKEALADYCIELDRGDVLEALLH